MIPWFVVNPHAGAVRFASIEREIRRRLPGPGAIVTADVPEVRGPGPRLVVAVGGDGTVNRVINRCDTRGLRLAVIPRGSANDLGAELRLPRDFERAWRVIEAGRYAQIDLLSVNGARFATCGGLGLAADVALRANGWKARASWRGRGVRALRGLVYPLAALAELRGAPRAIRATLGANGVERRVRLSTALVSNQARFGGLFSASPRASNTDGQLHFCGMQAAGRERLLWLAWQLLRGTPERCPEFFEVRARSLTLETEEDVAFFGDGEVLSRGRRFQIEVHPRALRVAVPDTDAALAGLPRAG